MIRRQVQQLLSRARSLLTTFQQGGEPRYIDEAILLDREAIDLALLAIPNDLSVCLSFPFISVLGTTSWGKQKI